MDSTLVGCGRSRDTVRRSDLAGYAQYGHCASHSRWFWGLRLHLLCPLHGLPVGFALAGANADERQVLLTIFDDAELAALLPGQMLIGDKNYHGKPAVLAPLGDPDAALVTEFIYAAIREAGVPESQVGRLERLTTTFVIGFAAS